MAWKGYCLTSDFKYLVEKFGSKINNKGKFQKMFKQNIPNYIFLGSFSSWFPVFVNIISFTLEKFLFFCSLE